MYQYKTVVTDYEGMQEALAVYGGQGWKLVSVAPDTWRIVAGQLGDVDSLGIGTSSTEQDVMNTRELSASYYMLIFEREDDLSIATAHESAVESLDIPNFSLPEY